MRYLPPGVRLALMRRSYLYALVALAVFVAGARAEGFEVVVVGSEPEGIAAAVAAAEEGARVLLLSGDRRLGGLFVLGQMNSLDLRTEPELLQRGLFERWWNRVGRGSAFDVKEAEETFRGMLSDAGVAVRLGVKGLEPMLEGRTVRGVRAGERVTKAEQVVDATAEGDLAAAAGVPFTLGFASVGLDERMADTLVFRMEGVDWEALQAGVRARGRGYAQVNERAAWGHFGGYPAAYEAREPGLRLRGLNLGRQADGSVLVNALLIYGVDPFDPASVADGRRRAEREARRIAQYLRALPGMESVTYGGVAERLYVRETRHFKTRCTLTVDDVLDNVVTDEDVAAGGYPLDVQTLTPHDDGYVYGVPEVYGVRLCVAVPERVENLWIVGKTAGYGPIAASSARVVPFGMALGEAVGVAAAQAAKAGRSTHAYPDDPASIQRLRVRLEARGAYLPAVKPRDPSGPFTHEFFGAYRVLRRKGLALGGYENDPKLDEEMPARGFLYLLANVGTRFWGDAEMGRGLVAAFPELSGPLTQERALAITAAASCERGRCAETWDALKAQGVAPEGFPPGGTLTRGEAYALAAGLAELQGAPAKAGGRVNGQRE